MDQSEDFTHTVDIKHEPGTVCPMCKESFAQNCGRCWHEFCFACFRRMCPHCDFEQPGLEVAEYQNQTRSTEAEVTRLDGQNDITGEADPLENQPPAEKKPKLTEYVVGEECCLKHGAKELELYCVTCEKRVCTECLVSCRDHKRHLIDSVSEIYAEKFEITKAKLEDVKNYIQDIRKANDDKKQVRMWVQQIEQDMLKRLDQLFQQARQELLNSVKTHSQLLVRNSRMPARKSKILQQLTESIHSMSKGHFIEQQANIHAQIDDTMSQPISYYRLGQRNYYDIKCNLLPRIRMLPTSVKIFDESSTQDTTLKPKIPVSDNNGNKWELCFSKEEYFSVQVRSKECSQNGNFLAVIILLNEDPLKVYQVQISLTSPSLADEIPSFEFFETSKLQSDGYVGPDGQLKLRCGIGPADPITERAYYKAFIERQHNELVSLKKTIQQHKEFTVGTHVITDQQSPDEKQQVEQRYLSHRIYDWDMTEWRLNVNIGPSDGFIGVFISKCNGAAGKYEYFIEMMHSTSPEQNRKVSTVHQFEQGLHGQARFLQCAKIPAYLRNGCLRFRYGVRAISENGN